MGEQLGTVDVLVLGAGPGGISAAIAAAERDMEVAIVERLSTVGGNLGYSSGYVALADTKFQRDHGIDDSPERFIDDLNRECQDARSRHGGVLVADVARRYAEESSVVYEWLEDVGASFRTLIDRPAKHAVPRLHALADPDAAVTALKERLEQLGVYVLTDVRAAELQLGDDRPRQILMTHDRTGQELEAGIRRSVVVATGGYQANFELRAEVQPAWLADTPYLGVPTTLGDGHKLLARAGARLLNMSFLPPFGHVATTFTEQAIAVNLRGERFHDETDPHETPRYLDLQPERRAFYVFDERTMREKSSYVQSLGRPIATASTLEALAEQLGIDGAGLGISVDRFNEAIRTRDVSELDVPRANLPDETIETPPFYGLEVVVGVSVTYGGAKTTPDGQAVDAFDRPIEGLYAIGNANGSVAPAVEVGGVNLGFAFVLGRIAGSCV